jgi:hypothetical protein
MTLPAQSYRLNLSSRMDKVELREISVAGAGEGYGRRLSRLRSSSVQPVLLKICLMALGPKVSFRL